MYINTNTAPTIDQMKNLSLPSVLEGLTVQQREKITALSNLILNGKRGEKRVRAAFRANTVLSQQTSKGCKVIPLAYMALQRTGKVTPALTEGLQTLAQQLSVRSGNAEGRKINKKPNRPEAIALKAAQEVIERDARIEETQRQAMGQLARAPVAEPVAEPAVEPVVRPVAGLARLLGIGAPRE
ncbi:hypothetical protein SCG7086_AI_00020 [Chlamydiales bacterium SCGC AG-110-P3]|nr:hypothetical protein SCG7086_AI_00020 [Chlamydiales bacterium SCGC AG-110-P3]